MIFHIDKILHDIRVCLDENGYSESLIQIKDTDALSLDEIIRAKVLPAVDQVHLSAPYYRIEQGHNFGDAVYWREMESGWVILPDDFLRLVVFEMSDWERPVFTAITPSDALYAHQRSRIKALRGTPQRPVCVLSIRQEGRVLEFYSCKDESAYVTRAVYIPIATMDEDGGIDISKRCYEAVVYTAASLSLVTLGEVERANALSTMATTLLQ